MKRCLVVTELVLSGLGARKHGIYQRLKLLLDGIVQSGYALEIICMADTEAAEPGDSADLRAIEKDLAIFWGINAKVLTASTRKSETTQPYIVRQVLGSMSYWLNDYMQSAKRGGRLDELAQALQTQPDIVLAHRLGSMAQVIAVGLALPPCYFDLDDVEHLAAYRSAKHALTRRQTLFAYLGLPSVMYAEYKAIKRAKTTFLCSNQDARHINRWLRVPLEKLTTIPNSARIEALQPIAPGKTLMMVGVMSYEPNSTGADFFIKEVWPLILASEPEAEFQVIGASPESIPAFGHAPPSVKFLGFVDDLEAAYRGARAIVCPILWGGGTRVKLVEAAVRGKPIVSTHVGCEGLNFEDQKHALIEDSAPGFARACLRLMKDDSLAQELGRQVHGLASQRFDRQKIIENLVKDFAGNMPAKNHDKA